MEASHYQNILSKSPLNTRLAVVFRANSFYLKLIKLYFHKVLLSYINLIFFSETDWNNKYLPKSNQLLLLKVMRTILF